MVEFLTRRLLLLVPTVIVISMIAFVVIQLPPAELVGVATSGPVRAFGRLRSSLRAYSRFSMNSA